MGQIMETLVTSRIDTNIKASAVPVFEKFGYTTSTAIRKLFDYAATQKVMPFEVLQKKPSSNIVQEKIAAFDSLRITGLEKTSDDDVKQARLKARYEDYL